MSFNNLFSVLAGEKRTLGWGKGGITKDLLWTNTWDYEDEWMGTDHTSHIVIDTNVVYDAFLIVGYPIEDCASTFIPVSNQYDPTDWSSSGEIAESALITYDTANTNGLGMYIRKFIIKHNKSDEGDWYSFEFEKNIEYWFGIAQGWESYANESNWENVPYKIYGIKF